MSAVLLPIAAATTSLAPTPSQAPSSAVWPLIAVQRQLGEVIASLSDEQYVQKPVGVIASSIGGHVRHCLDHVDAILAAARSGELNYDHRERGTEVESCRQAALVSVARQEQQLVEVARLPNNLQLRLTTLLASSERPIRVATSLGRELSFVLSHTVHHSALISAMVMTLGVAIPDRFGYAPATIAYLEQLRCAQ